MLTAMRSLLVTLAAAAALLLGACDAVTTTAAKYNPFASFETRCARLPPGRVEVQQDAINVVTDDTLSFHELTRLGKGNPATHRTLGLTRAEFRQDAQVDIAGLNDAGGGRACSRPQIRVKLSMTPMTVNVASELRNMECARNVVYEHEMKHVAVYRQHMTDAARELEATLPALFGQRIIVARDPAAGQAQVHNELQAFLGEFSARSSDELKREQDAVDTAEEYARVSNACGSISIE
jgi:hypothetical protein